MEVTAPKREGVPVADGDFCSARAPRVGVLVYSFESPKVPPDKTAYHTTFQLVGEAGVVVGPEMSMAHYRELAEGESCVVPDGVFFQTTLTHLGQGRVKQSRPLAKWLSGLPLMGSYFTWAFGTGVKIVPVG